MKWLHKNSPRKKKFKSGPSADKIVTTFFWDSEGAILIDTFTAGQTINSEVCIESLKKLKRRFSRVRPHKNVNQILLQHNNTRPLTSLHIRWEITKFEWTTLSHPPYSPDLAPSFVWAPQRCYPREATWIIGDVKYGWEWNQLNGTEMAYTLWRLHDVRPQIWMETACVE